MRTVGRAGDSGERGPPSAAEDGVCGPSFVEGDFPGATQTRDAHSLSANDSLLGINLQNHSHLFTRIYEEQGYTHIYL